MSLKESLVKQIYDRNQNQLPFNENDLILISESMLVDDILHYLQGNENPLNSRVKLEEVLTKNIQIEGK